jgi:SAM-dependent methyltransferase
MKEHDHATMRGHIAHELFDPLQRQMWRQTRYLEALRAHHEHSTDRAALLHVMGVLFDALRDCERELPAAKARKAILDVGCGTGEVSARLLGMLAGWTPVDYLGIDINADLLPETQQLLTTALGSDSTLHLRRQDYSDLQGWSGEPEALFDFVWLIHSGYYLTQGHEAFVDALEGRLSTSGLLVLIHNPEGNAPFRAAADALGLCSNTLPYWREIVVPTVAPEVFEALASGSGDLETFSRRFEGSQEARELRLMLEFYLPDYPLEALPPEARSIYVNRWQQHLAAECGRFFNRHEMLLIWPRTHSPRMRSQLMAYMNGVLANE